MDLVALNEQLQAEYRRVTGGSNRFNYLAWIASRMREAMHAQHEDPKSATWLWDGLPKPEQRARVLAYLQTLPPRGGS